MTQSAYCPLELPYMFLGIGKTNNYIENFNMGIPKAFDEEVRIYFYFVTTFWKDLQKKSWTPIIPNSQLIVNPVLENEYPS